MATHGAAPLSVKRGLCKGGVAGFVIEGCDTTWLSVMVGVCHELSPDADVVLLRQHPHDSHLEFHASDLELVRGACDVLLGRLAKLSTEDGKDELECTANAPDLATANLLRRALMSRIDVLACDEVEVFANTSAFEDERVAHRLGQISFISELDLVEARLAGKDRNLLARDIHFPGGGVAVVPEMEDALICKLRPGERWESALTLRRGTASRHAKYAAVACPGFEPECRLQDELPEQAASILREAGMICGEDRVVRSLRGPVRQECLAELAPSSRLVWPPRSIGVVVRSLGQHGASRCVELALSKVREEIVIFRDAVAQAQ